MNFYEVLGVDTDPDPSDVRQAFRKRARRFHPDVNDQPEARDQFKVLIRARDVLADSEERTAYDRLGHAEYVDERIDGEFPGTEVIPHRRVGTDSDRTAESTSSRDEASSQDVRGANSSAGPEGDAMPRESDASASAGGPTQGPDVADKTETGRDGQDEARGDESNAEHQATGGSGRSEGNVGTGTESAATASAGSAAAGGTGTVTHSVPPTPGAAKSAGKTASRGPQRVTEDQTPTTWRISSVFGRVVEHFAISGWWFGVAAIAGAYLAGFAGYLSAHSTGVDALAGALSSSEPVAAAEALRRARYGVPSVTAYLGHVGLLTGGVPSDPALVLAGAVLLPVSLALAVSTLRRKTTWRPTWLYVVGSLGPAAAVALANLASRPLTTSPVAAVPLLADLLLLAAIPGVVVASFLVNRLLVVAPLRRRTYLTDRPD